MAGVSGLSVAGRLDRGVTCDYGYMLGFIGRLYTHMPTHTQAGRYTSTLQVQTHCDLYSQVHTEYMKKALSSSLPIHSVHYRVVCTASHIRDVLLHFQQTVIMHFTDH